VAETEAILQRKTVIRLGAKSIAGLGSDCVTTSRFNLFSFSVNFIETFRKNSVAQDEVFLRSLSSLFSIDSI